MKHLFHVVAAIAFASALPQLSSGVNGPTAHAQQPPAAAASEPGPLKSNDPSYKIDATLVNVDVMVTDDDGRVLTGLKRGNFRILDNGVPQKVIDFAPTSAPITIVVLMEYSAASYNYFAGKAADWRMAFLSHLEPRDWVALTTFDMRSKVQVDFTHKQYEIRDAIAQLGFPQFRESNLLDALGDTLDRLDGVRGRKSILLLATGLDSLSATTLDEIRERLRRTDATIFCIGLAEAEYMRYGGSSMSYLQGKNALTTFAKQTGGLALFPRFEGELPDIFRSVVGFLRSEYTLSFRPPLEIRDGRYHRLKVEIVGPDAKPLKVTDAKGKSHKIEVFAREGYIAPKG
jgi:Ca-activated chloride channel family protein